jgi:sec-independent protein translocase protein TatA
MGFIGAQELLLILLIVVVLFGAKKIPELAKGMGSGIREFKKAAKDEAEKKEVEAKKDETEKKKEPVDTTKPS